MDVDAEDRFRTFFDRYYAMIYNSFHVRIRNPVEAEDLTQETFMRAAGGFERAETNPSLGWLMTISGNVFKNWLRYHAADKRDGIEKSIEDESGLGVDHQAQQERILMSKQQMSALDQAIRQLPPGQRRCFQLFYFQEYKYQEIAQLLDIEIQTVKSQLNRGRKKVVEVLERMHDDHGGHHG